MNIFVLDRDPKVAAQMHLDKHVVKMVIEYAQLLSTAHRLLDGRLEVHKGPNTKPKKFWLLGDERVHEQDFFTETLNQDTNEMLIEHNYKLVIENPICYSASHQNHPCAVWTRTSNSNYQWLFELFAETSAEFTHRYGKVHKTWLTLKDFLQMPPKNIAVGARTPFPQAMGDEFKVPNDSIAAYRNYYNGPKASFARWTNRQQPDWFAGHQKD